MLLDPGCICAGPSCGCQPHWGITTTTADGRPFGCCLTLCLQVARYWAAAGDHPLQQAVCSISLLCIGLSIIAISAGFLSCCNFCSRGLIKLQASSQPTLQISLCGAGVDGADSMQLFAGQRAIQQWYT